MKGGYFIFNISILKIYISLAIFLLLFTWSSKYPDSYNKWAISNFHLQILSGETFKDNSTPITEKIYKLNHATNLDTFTKK